MRLSISTRIFVSFAVVIVAFGATCAFAIYRMGELRGSVTVLWQEVIPIQNDLRALSRRVKSVEELFAWKRPNTPRIIHELLPGLEPFKRRGIGVAINRLDALAKNESLAEPDRAAFAAARSSLAEFVSGSALVEATEGEPLPDIDHGLSSGEFYEQLVYETVRKANAGTLDRNSAEARATAKVLRRLYRATADVTRQLSRAVAEIDQRVDREERATTLTVVITAGGALLLSLLMLAMSQLTLAPLRQLREGVRRIAAGNYEDKIKVRSSNEIGQLAEEFNTMAESLATRDAQVQRQREELLRAERLAIIGKLAAQITHEVRNPLSSIGLNAELLEEELEETGGGEDAKASLRAILEEVQRLKSITEEYLHFARLPLPNVEMVDIGALLTSFLTFLAREVEMSGVTLTTAGLSSSLEGGPPPIRADADQLRQAFLNIARNALEALRSVDPATPKRCLSVSLKPAPTGGVIVQIGDSGPGIDPVIKARIFDPFVTGKAHGTGLGLALTREIVVEHGGTIVAESPLGPDGGTAFIVTLPSRSERMSPSDV
ncbi:MAG: two-component system NtrC family sensor kinase [Myxococcota bacterium]|jgi:two-component system NtrC family sensor kinase